MAWINLFSVLLRTQHFETLVVALVVGVVFRCTDRHTFIRVCDGGACLLVCLFQFIPISVAVVVFVLIAFFLLHLFHPFVVVGSSFVVFFFAFYKHFICAVRGKKTTTAAWTPPPPTQKVSTHTSENVINFAPGRIKLLSYTKPALDRCNSAG